MDRHIASLLAAMAIFLPLGMCLAQGDADPFDFPRRDGGGGDDSGDLPERPTNQVPRLKSMGGNGSPEGWEWKRFNGSDEAHGEVVEEGRHGGSCFKISAKAATSSGFQTRSIPVEPGKSYRFGGWIRTSELETKDDVGVGASFTVLPAVVRSKDFVGTQEWKHVRGKFTAGDETTIQLVAAFGGSGIATGTAWYENIYFIEDGGDNGEPPPPPAPYRRPLLDDPLFNPEGLTLDKDQTIDLANMIASLVINFPKDEVVNSHEFRAQALGIALRMDPRNRTAVVANGQFDAGQSPRPEKEGARLQSTWNYLDEWVKLLHSRDASSDDKILGRYLGDLTRRIRPEEGFSPEFAKLHRSADSVDWSRVLPPAPAIVPDSPPTIAENTPENPSPHENPEEPDHENDPPSTGQQPPPPISGNSSNPEEKFRVPVKLALEKATLLAPAQSGGKESRAAMRRVTLNWMDYEWRDEWVEGQGEVKRKVPINSSGSTYLHFDDDWWGLRSRWDDIVKAQMARRYEGWPQRGVVYVDIPYYSNNSGSIAALSTAICFEAMARGLTLDPRVAAAGTWTEEGELTTHSHLPGVVLGYGKDWSDILLVGPGSAALLEPLASSGLVSPFLHTQIIEVANFGEAVNIASGQRSPQLQKAIDAYKAVQALRMKMDAATLVKNKFVIDKLREVSASAPNHLSAALMVKSSMNQDPMDFNATMDMVSRLYRSLEQLAESDLDWVSSEEGTQTIELFNERMRELKPRMDRSVDRLNIKFDDVTRALGEAVRIRDRTTSTANRKMENAKEKVRETRQAIDIATAAGR